MEYLTTYSGMLPLIAGLIGKEKPFSIFYAFSFCVGIVGLTMYKHNIDNTFLYWVYTAIEFMFFMYLLLEYSRLNKWFLLFPLLIISLTFGNDILLTKWELASLLVLGLYSAFISVQRRASAYEYLMIAGIVWYSFNLATYSYNPENVRFFQFMDITKNLIFTFAMGVKIWNSGYTRSSSLQERLSLRLS
jgi:hypothetical protein